MIDWYSLGNNINLNIKLSRNSFKKIIFFILYPMSQFLIKFIMFKSCNYIHTHMYIYTQYILFTCLCIIYCVIFFAHLWLFLSLSVRASLKINKKSKESVSKGMDKRENNTKLRAAGVSRLSRASVSFVDLLWLMPGSESRWAAAKSQHRK